MMSDESPLTKSQSLRAVGLGTALALHGFKLAATEEMPTAAEVCKTADDLAEYVRNGTIPKNRPL